MISRTSGAVASAAVVSALALTVSACGGGGNGGSASATDKASGLTVTVTDDQVKLKRSAASTAGTAGTSATVSCTDDYTKLVKATAVPAPTQPWYATTLITWPDKSQESSARLSHGLSGDPQVCVAQTSDSAASAVLYFSAKARDGVKQLQVKDSQSRQAAQASAALQAGAQAATGALSQGAFPKADALVAAITQQGLYAKGAPSTAAATESGTLYVITGQTTAKRVVLAIKDAQGKVRTATQAPSGKPRIATVR